MRRTKDDPTEDSEEESHEDFEGLAPSGEKTEMSCSGGVSISGDLVGVFAVGAEEDEGQEEESVICAPGYKSPIGSMPKAGKKEDDKSVADDFPFPDARAAKRNIDIIAEPRCERNMPTTPELGYVTREIGIVEVAHEFDAEEFSGSDSYVRISGEIAVDLKGEEDRGKK